MSHLQETLDQPSLRDWTRLFSFFQALRARLPSFRSLRDKCVMAPPPRCDKLALMGFSPGLFSVRSSGHTKHITTIPPAGLRRSLAKG